MPLTAMVLLIGNFLPDQQRNTHRDRPVLPQFQARVRIVPAQFGFLRKWAGSPRRARRPRRRNRLPGFMDVQNLAAVDSGRAAPGFRGCLCLTRHRGGRSSPLGDEREGAIYNRNRKRVKLRLPAVAGGRGKGAAGKIIPIKAGSPFCPSCRLALTTKKSRGCGADIRQDKRSLECTARFRRGSVI